jgi:ubiquinone/menaquinone biosynthesis C-methylase UbiE
MRARHNSFLFVLWIDVCKYLYEKEEKEMSEATTEERIKEAVRENYAGIARRFIEEPGSPAPAGCCGPSSAAERSEERPTRTSCCGPSEADLVQTGAARFYSEEELADLPETVTDASLGCGNPLAIAELQPGEVVLDLGSGGGIDCFLAAKKVGPEGQVIGLDMTPDMIRLARRNAKKVGLRNVDFRFGEMEDMPLPDASVDVIISNCVINLSPDKDSVFREAYRVLRPGGRLSVSDIVVDGDLPEIIRSRLDAWAACVAGALDESIYLGKMRAAGFEKVEVLSREYSEIDEATEWDQAQVIVLGDDGQDAKDVLIAAGLSPSQLARKVASIKVRALKPA